MSSGFFRALKLALLVLGIGIGSLVSIGIIRNKHRKSGCE